MASYINTNYFVGDIDIPDTSTLEVADKIDLFIKKNEAVFLTRFLGQTMYQNLLSNTTFADPITGTGVWNDLIQGAAFTDSNGNANYMEGLTGYNTYSDNGFYRSPIANYVYSVIRRQSITTNTGVGEVLPQTENSLVVSPSYKIATAWNEMTNLLWVIHDYLEINKTDFPDYIGLKYPPTKYTYNSFLQPNQKLFVRENIWGI